MNANTVKVVKMSETDEVLILLLVNIIFTVIGIEIGVLFFGGC